MMINRKLKAIKKKKNKEKTKFFFYQTQKKNCFFENTTNLTESEGKITKLFSLLISFAKTKQLDFSTF